MSRSSAPHLRAMPHAALVIFLAAGALAACSDSPTGPADQININGLEWRLVLESDSIPSGSTFTATVTLHNTRPTAVSMASTCSGLGHVHFEIFRDEERMSAWGGGCEHVIGVITVEPGATWEHSAEMTAVRNPGGTPLDEGRYFVYADAKFGSLPLLVKEFTVTEAVDDGGDGGGDDEENQSGGA
jgi:hypothetical protein